MTGPTRGKSLELYFVDGKPDGLLTAEVFNWTGHILVVPRIQLGEALKRKEAQYAGVYILIGSQDNDVCVYIGESEDISARIKSHDISKDWWTKAILITSAANGLNKAHVRYLEARLVEEATEARKVRLENGNTPSRAGLSEAARANMEAFLEHIFMVLPALQIDCFVKNTRPSIRTGPTVASTYAIATFELNTPKHGIRAIARVENDEFVVQEGSLARKSWEGKGSENTAYGQLYLELVKTGILQEQETLRVFTKNYAFKSPSAAGAVVNGRPTNGTVEWKVQRQSKTYKEWEAEQLLQN